MKTFRFTVPEPSLTQREKEGTQDKGTEEKRNESLLFQSWLLVMGLFSLFHFWTVKSETFWLLTLDVYKGDETIDLVTVSLGRNGIFSLGTAFLFLGYYLTLVVSHFKRKRVQQSGGIND